MAVGWIVVQIYSAMTAERPILVLSPPKVSYEFEWDPTRALMPMALPTDEPKKPDNYFSTPFTFWVHNAGQVNATQVAAHWKIRDAPSIQEVIASAEPLKPFHAQLGAKGPPVNGVQALIFKMYGLSERTCFIPGAPPEYETPKRQLLLTGIACVDEGWSDLVPFLPSSAGVDDGVKLDMPAEVQGSLLMRFASIPRSTLVMDTHRVGLVVTLQGTGPPRFHAVRQFDVEVVFRRFPQGKDDLPAQVHGELIFFAQASGA